MAVCQELQLIYCLRPPLVCGYLLVGAAEAEGCLGAGVLGWEAVEVAVLFGGTHAEAGLDGLIAAQLLCVDLASENLFERLAELASWLELGFLLVLAFVAVDPEFALKGEASFVFDDCVDHEAPALEGGVHSKRLIIIVTPSSCPCVGACPPQR